MGSGLSGTPSRRIWGNRSQKSPFKSIPRPRRWCGTARKSLRKKLLVYIMSMKKQDEPRFKKMYQPYWGKKKGQLLFHRFPLLTQGLVSPQSLTDLSRDTCPPTPSLCSRPPNSSLKYLWIQCEIFIHSGFIFIVLDSVHLFTLLDCQLLEKLVEEALPV